MSRNKILIVNESFHVGGIESAMINMANELSQYYEVHLFIYNPVGVLRERLCSDIKVLDPSWMLRSLGMSFREAMRSKNVRIIIFRFLATLWTKLFSNRLPLGLAIKHQPKLTGYDLAIAFHQERCKKAVVSGFARVVDGCVEANKKVSWLHYDSNAIDLDSQYNNPFYQKMDKVVCVSKSLMESFAKSHPELKNKMDYCYNCVPYDSIKDKSLQIQEFAYPSDKFVCFSACRLAKEKAIARAISTLSEVLKAHDEVVWYIAGEGPERSNIENVIKINGLENQVVLIGNQSNPYPYIRNADLLMNVSYHEAAPMVFLESKALGTPIFATRTSSVDELLIDGKDSFICENSEEGICELFSWIIENKERVEEAKVHLQRYHASNDELLLRIRNWIK